MFPKPKKAAQNIGAAFFRLPECRACTAALRSGMVCERRQTLSAIHNSGIQAETFAKSSSLAHFFAMRFYKILKIFPYYLRASRYSCFEPCSNLRFGKGLGLKIPFLFSGCPFFPPFPKVPHEKPTRRPPPDLRLDTRTRPRS